MRRTFGRLGPGSSTKGRPERGMLRLLTVPNENGNLAARIKTELDTSGVGVGRPRQDRLLEHVLVAAERLNEWRYEPRTCRFDSDSDRLIDW